ncbi:glycosyltransferase family 2 protein [Cognatishimia sp. F0-27]|uniref:glycosyltransferase family 2 protein n=1 Tax=Cognatishimia sp. F0-27 TaxID=2816855 RepID=UPI001D0C88DD|nr:glycosyltransferase family 2 protein [Cognatishimia sp. F0-27]MCC1491544.1 glycosyltransferase family 2 protein [Cognatishimia sp. F0-27]
MQPNAAPSWSVVATVAEPLPLLMAFVAHHVSLGAREVILHLDTPDAEAERVLGAVPGCVIVPPGDRAAGVHMPTPMRQARNATQTYRTVQAEWLLHIDADEFLVDIDHVMRALRSAPAEVMGVGVRPCDRFWLSETPPETIFDGQFRTVPHPPQPFDVEAVYGDAARYLDLGLSGNAADKCFTRTGQALDIGVHRPARPDGTPVPIHVMSRATLLHFDGLTPAHFIAKMARKIEQQPNWSAFPAPGRRAQLVALWQAGRDQAVRDRLVRDTKCVTPEQRAALAEAGRLDARSFDPTPALRAVFGSVPDLSVAAFDARALPARRIGAFERLRNTVRSMRRLKRKTPGA